MNYRSLAHDTLQAMLRGSLTTLPTPGDLGPWTDLVTTVHAEYARGGAPAAIRCWDVLCAAQPELHALLAGSPVPPADTHQVPALPAEAQEAYRHAAPVARWLDDYIAFAAAALPMTPRSFHQAAGLFAVSVAIARRLCVRASTDRIFPNLYVLYIAPSGQRRKSTAFRGLSDLLEQAGLWHLLLPQKMTPEAMLERMSSTKVKPLPPHERQRWLREKAFAGQRGWMRDEVSALFSSMKRDFNSELLELVMELYDCKNRVVSATIGRGDDVVERTYLSFFGAGNPDTMGPHLANRSHWLNGLFARFAMLQPGADEPKVWQFYGDAMDIPASILSGLRTIYRLFPEPVAELVEETEKNKSSYLTIENIPEPQVATIEPGAWAAWAAYSKATGFTLLEGDDIDPALVASYTRLGTQAIKVAMLLAVMDTEVTEPVRITLPHFVRAQQIVEGWRATLHQLWEVQSTTDETKLMQRIVREVKRSRAGLTQRDLCVKLRSSAKETQEALEVLRRAGRIKPIETRGANGRMVELWQEA